MNQSESAEIRKDSASMKSVRSGPMVETRMPAMAGPTTKLRLKMASAKPLARPTWSRPTRVGMAAVQPARKRTRSALMGKVTSRMTPMVGSPKMTESGMSAVSRARPRSA